MFAFEINFFPTKEARESKKSLEAFYDQLESLLAALRQNGNVISEWQVVELDEFIQARVMTPEKESLDTKYFTNYVPPTIERLKPFESQPFQARLIGKIGTLGSCCSCENPSSFLLFTTFLDVGLPVNCCDCGAAVPLYKLPVLEPEKDYWPLYNWQGLYAQWDGIWMNSFVGERLAYHQLSNPRSQFMRRTREIAKQLEEASGKPVFTYLMHHSEKWSESCPLCKRPWRTGKGAENYEFECEHCRILSPEASSEAQPLSELHP